MQAHRNQTRREGISLPQDPGALYDFNLDEELEIDLDDEAMEAMFGQDLASENDILGMWIPEVLDWPTWVCVTQLGLPCFLIAIGRPIISFLRITPCVSSKARLH